MIRCGPAIFIGKESALGLQGNLMATLFVTHPGIKVFQGFTSS